MLYFGKERHDYIPARTGVAKKIYRQNIARANLSYNDLATQHKSGDTITVNIYKSGGDTGHRGCKWYANRASPLYKNDCNSIQPKSYDVYIWRRIA